MADRRALTDFRTLMKFDGFYQLGKSKKLLLSASRTLLVQDHGSKSVRRNMKRLTTIIYASLIIFSFNEGAYSETINDLKGLSIRTVWNLQNQVRDFSANETRTVTFHVDRNVYVSFSGRIFQYNFVSLEKIPRLSVAELDKAYARGGVYENELYTWTFLGGHLSQVGQFVRGFRIFTYIIDPRTLTCNLQVRDEPDPVTRNMIGHSMKDGRLIEISDLKFSGFCTVSKGNIFAGDQ
jgi:hypothetical protein